jgi:hypothetical protein
VLKGVVKKADKGKKRRKKEGMERGYIGNMTCQMDCGTRWKGCC